MGSAVRSMRRALASNRNKSLYGLTNFSTAAYLQTASGGGEPGVATGFGFVGLCQLRSIPTANDYILSSVTGTFPALIAMAAGFRFWTLNGVAGNVAGSARAFVASDIGKVFLVFGRRAANDTCDLYVDRAICGASTAAVGYTVGSGGMGMGGLPGGATSLTILGILTFRGAPTDAQIIAFFDRVRERGDLPETMAGVTVTHRWSAKDQLLRLSNPAGRKTYGARLFSAANNFASASSATGITGSTSGFWVAAVIRHSGTLSGTPEAIVSHSNGGTNGWAIAWSGTLIRGLYPGVSAQGVAPTSADIGQLRLVLFNGLGTAAPHTLYYGSPTAFGTQGVATMLPSTGVMTIGSYTGGAAPAPSFQVFGVVGGNVAGGLTLAQVQQAFAEFEATGKTPTMIGLAQHRYDLTDDIVANGGAMPTTLLDRAAGGTDNLTRTGTLEVADYTETVPAAPAQLTDTQTLASVDAFLRVGTPAVRLVDPAIDGRRTLGAQGFSAANYLATVGNLGMPGVSTGFWGAVYWRPDALPSAGGDILAVRQNNPANAGWTLSSDTTGIRFGCSNAATYTNVVGSPVVAGDVGQMRVAIFCHTGATIVLYVEATNGVLVQVGAPAAVGAFTAASTPMALGCRVSDFGSPATRSSIFGFACGHAAGGITLAQAQACFDAIKATGRIQGVPGLTDHLYDLTADILASGVDTVPAQALDRAPGGTDHLTNSGALVVTHAAQKGVRFCLTSPASGNTSALYYRTLTTGGIRGTQAGFHISCKVTVTSQAAQNNHNLISTYEAFVGGYNLSFINNNTQIQCTTYNVSTGTSTAAYTIPGAKVGVPFIVDAVHTGSQLQLWIDGVQQGADVPVGAYTTSTVAMCVGVDSRLLAVTVAESITVHAVSGGHTVPTPAELLARATASITASSLTQLSGGKTQKHWDFQAAIVGDVVPGRVVDAVAGEVLIGVGSPLVLAQETKRLWSYEMSPIIYGAQTFSATDFYSIAAGLAGSTAGFFVSVLYMIRSQAVASAPRILLAKRGAGNSGWNISTSTTHATISMTLSTTTSTYATPASVVAASDVGKLMLFTGVLDAPALKLRGYIKRAEIGTGTTFAGTFLPETVSMLLGRRSTDVFPADTGIEIYGFTCGDAIPTLAEIQALHDACMAAEDIQNIPGKSSMTISLKRDALANGGALPATLLDRVGSSNMARAGAGPVVATQFARAWGW